MLLVLNIGNTNSAGAIFDAETIVTTHVQSTTDLPYHSAMQEFTQTTLRNGGIKRDKITGCIISSVVPAHTSLWTGFLRDTFGSPPTIISAKMPTGIRIDYDDPSTLGSDRLCACVAGFVLYGGPGIIIDFGTATTFNLIDAAGNFLGGAIAPGIITAARSLHRNTAQLPEISFTPPSHFPGKSTRECLEAGIFYSGLDSARGMIARSKVVIGSATTVVATGGLSETLKQHIPEIDFADPNLVLRGAVILYNRSRQVMG